MQSVAWNRRAWNENYHWTDRGEEWSRPWGSPVRQWQSAILPRIRAFLPTGTCLEIAPGFGRWTEFLKAHCRKLIGVDLSPRCVEACRRRFGEYGELEFHENDGRSLDMVADGSIDFAFSFDALVHAEADVVRAYLSQLARKLTPDGVGFVHHSNLGEYAAYFRAQRIPLAGSLLKRSGLLTDTATRSRALSMTAGKFAEFCRDAGLACITQETVNWNSVRQIDCMSVFTHPTSKWATENRLLRNPNFMLEAQQIRQMPPEVKIQFEKFRYANAA